MNYWIHIYDGDIEYNAPAAWSGLRGMLILRKNHVESTAYFLHFPLVF